MFLKNIFKRKNNKKRKEVKKMKNDILFDDFLEDLRDEVCDIDDENLVVCFTLHPEEDGVDSKTLRLGGINVVDHPDETVLYFDLFDDQEEE